MPNKNEKDDLMVRAKAFNAELIPLLGKYKLGLAAVPLLSQEGTIIARPQLFNDSKEESATKLDVANTENTEVEEGLENIPTV